MEPKTEICPRCGRKLEFALPPGGKGNRLYRCFNCGGPDPLKDHTADGYLRGLKSPEK